MKKIKSEQYDSQGLPEAAQGIGPTDSHSL